MEGLPQDPAGTPPPADETHPTKGRCFVCKQKLRRLWLWQLGKWTADKWCSDACYTKHIAAIGKQMAIDAAKARAARLAQQEGCA